MVSVLYSKAHYPGRFGRNYVATILKTAEQPHGTTEFFLQKFIFDRNIDEEFFCSKSDQTFDNIPI